MYVVVDDGGDYYEKAYVHTKNCTSIFITVYSYLPECGNNQGALP